MGQDAARRALEEADRKLKGAVAPVVKAATRKVPQTGEAVQIDRAGDVQLPTEKGVDPRLQVGAANPKLDYTAKRPKVKP